MAAAAIQTPSHYAHHHHHRPSSSSNTTSVMMNSPDTYNMASTLPSVDFSFSSLRDRMTAFSAKFDAFIEKGRRQVLSERNDYRGRISELREEQSSTLRALSALQSTHKLHSSMISQQSAELTELHGTIAQITARRDGVEAGNERLRTRIEETKRRIEAKRERQREYARQFERQKGRDAPEVAFWEGLLGMRLESAAAANSSQKGGGGVMYKEGWIRVLFWELPTTLSSTSTVMNEAAANADAGSGAGAGLAGEAWFELDCSTAAYKLGKCVPSLPTPKTDEVLQRLNQEGDIAAFLKRMRGVIVDVLMNGNRSEIGNNKYTASGKGTN